MNFHLLDNPQAEHNTYFQDLVKLIKTFKFRFSAVLHTGLYLEQERTGQ